MPGTGKQTAYIPNTLGETVIAYVPFIPFAFRPV
jgi:hypothetical protein